MDFNMTMAEVRRAMSLDRSFYQEVANDDSYGPKALQIVIIAAALTGLGSFLGALLRGNFFGAIIALILGVVMAVVGYYIWAYVVQFVGASFFKGQATTPQLLRVLGYAYAADGPRRPGLHSVCRRPDCIRRRHLEPGVRLLRRARDP